MTPWLADLTSAVLSVVGAFFLLLVPSCPEGEAGGCWPGWPRELGSVYPEALCGSILAFKLRGYYWPSCWPHKIPTWSLELVSPFCTHLSDGESLSAGGERDGPPGQEMSLGSGPGAPQQCLALAYPRHCYQ